MKKKSSYIAWIFAPTGHKTKRIINEDAVKS